MAVRWELQVAEPACRTVWTELATSLWACFESGFLSGALFFLATLAYVVALSFSDPETATHDDRVKASQLWFVGAILFLAESGLDLLHSIWTRNGNPEGDLEEPLVVKLPSSYWEEEPPCCPWIDDVYWPLWQALFFMVPSFLYLVESLLDPNVADFGWLNVLAPWGWSNVEYSFLLDTTAAVLFVIDALITLVGRWSAIRQTATEHSLVLLDFLRAGNFFDMHWSAWGDGLFLVGSLLSLAQALTEQRSLDELANAAWLMDAVFYMCGSMPLMRAVRRARKLADAPVDGPWSQMQRTTSRQALRRHWEPGSEGSWGLDVLA